MARCQVSAGKQVRISMSGGPQVGRCGGGVHFACRGGGAELHDKGHNVSIEGFPKAQVCEPEPKTARGRQHCTRYGVVFHHTPFLPVPENRSATTRNLPTFL